MHEITCKQCLLLLDQNGKLKRGQELLKFENKRKAKKIKEQYEELQKQERQIELLTDQVERMGEDRQNEVGFSSQRDERDLEIADELEEASRFLHDGNYFAGDHVLMKTIDKMIIKLRGEEQR